MKLIDGHQITLNEYGCGAEEVKEMIAAGKKRPHLAVIIVGHDGGSETYVASKVKSCEQVGFKSTKITYENDVTEAELLSKIDELNKDEDVDGFIVQLPLPKHISEQKVIEAIDPKNEIAWQHKAELTQNFIEGVYCQQGYELIKSNRGKYLPFGGPYEAFTYPKDRSFLYSMVWQKK